MTTTAAEIDEDLLNRCLVLTIDEGRQQTAAIQGLAASMHWMAAVRKLVLGLDRKSSPVR